MIQHVEAIYERGVLRPLKPLPLAESQRVSLTISDSAASDSASPRSLADSEFLDAIRAEAVTLRAVPSLEEVQRTMSKIPGSLVEDFIAAGSWWQADSRPLGVPRNAAAPAVVVTAYRPDPKRWTEDFLKRKA
jgi:predicted DNA-binding antitoxin AbrB/MazE fold protein